MSISYALGIVTMDAAPSALVSANRPFAVLGSRKARSYTAELLFTGALLVTADDRWEDAVRRGLRHLDDYRALARVLAQRREPSAELAAFRDELPQRLPG